jgi:excisionase family DNA binding protein
VRHLESDLALTTREVAELLEVHPSTVKRWSDDGSLPSLRTGGGHRRIGLRSALDVARTRDIGTILDQFEPFQAHVWAAVREAIDQGTLARAQNLALGWVLRGHAERLGALLLLLGQHPAIPLWRFLDDGVRPLLATVGEYWSQGKLGVGDEHFVSQTVLEVFFELASGPGRTRVPLARDGYSRTNLAIVGATEGDQHHLGAMAARLVLEHHGWRVLNLGPDTPVEEFASVQSARGAALVCLSLSQPSADAKLRRSLPVLSRLYDHQTPYRLVLGGPELEPGAMPDLDGPFQSVDRFSSAWAFDEWLERIAAEAVEGAA